MKNLIAGQADILKQPSRILKSEISIGNFNCNDENIESISLEQKLTDDGTYTIGTCAANKLTVNIIGDDTIFDSIDFSQKIAWKVSIYNVAGISDPDVAYADESNWATYAFENFKIKNVKRKKNHIAIEAYDESYDLDQIAYGTSLDYPCTLSSAINEAKLVAPANIPSVSIAERMTGTNKDAYKIFALLCGGNIKNTAENQFAIVQPTAAAWTITPDDYEYLNYLGNGIQKISRFEAQLTDAEGNAYSLYSGDTSGATFVIASGIITGQSDLDKLAAAYLPLTYQAFELRSAGYPHLEVGDVITVDDKSLIICNHTLTYNGGLRSEISAEELPISGSLTANKGVGSVTQTVAKLNADIIKANAIVTKELEAQNAKIENLEAGQITVDTIKAEIAKMDLVTAEQINGKYMEVEDFVADSVTAATGQFTKYLTGVNIVGDNIEANTIKADKLIVTGEDGLMYEINASSSGLSQSQLSAEKYKKLLNGTCIVADSITADQIAGSTITGNEIAANTISSANIKAGSIKAADIDTADLFATNATIKNMTIDNSCTLKCDLDGVGGTFTGQIEAANLYINANEIKNNYYRTDTIKNSFEDGITLMDLSGAVGTNAKYSAINMNEGTVNITGNLTVGGQDVLTPDNVTSYAASKEEVQGLADYVGNSISDVYNNVYMKGAADNIFMPKNGGYFGGDVHFQAICDCNGQAYFNSATYAMGVYANTSSNAYNVRVATTWPYQLLRSTASSRRYKHDIVPLQSGGEAATYSLTNNAEVNTLDPHRLYDLTVYQYKYNEDYLSESDNRYLTDVPGFIAEDVAEIYPIAADLNDDGTVEDWNERFIIPPMLKLIQEQHEQILQLTARIEELENKDNENQ